VRKNEEKMWEKKERRGMRRKRKKGRRRSRLKCTLRILSSVHFCHKTTLQVRGIREPNRGEINIFYKNSKMQPFEFVLILNMTTCFGKIIFPSSGPRYTVCSVV
jgi:hypothetical protein